jgi:hypothetical protein
MRRPAPTLLLVFAALLAISSSAFAQNPPQAKATPDMAPLKAVIEQVQKALAEYQTNLGGGVDALPPLASAVFDFKATSAIGEGGTISFFIFKFGVSHESAVTNDVTFTYSVPKPPAGLSSKNQKPPELKDTLAQTIQSAAAAVKTAAKMGNLSFTKLVVSVQYGVKWEGNITAGAQISFVTVGLSGAKSVNTVQTVNLTFGQ